MARRSRKSQARRFEPEPMEAAPPPAAQRARAQTGFNPDYTHVRTDLRRIGFLAGSFILAMIIGAILFR